MRLVLEQVLHCSGTVVGNILSPRWKSCVRLSFHHSQAPIPCEGLCGLLWLLNGSEPETAHPSNSSSPRDGWCCVSKCAANRIATLGSGAVCPQMWFKLCVVHTFERKTAHIYANDCRGKRKKKKRRLIPRDQRCLPHAVRVKYLASARSRW